MVRLFPPKIFKFLPFAAYIYIYIYIYICLFVFFWFLTLIQQVLIMKYSSLRAKTSERTEHFYTIPVNIEYNCATE